MRLLIVSPFFPPYPSVAVARIASLTRFLKRKGYDITVLTNEINENAPLNNEDELIRSVKRIKVKVGNRKRFFELRDLYISSFHKIMRENKYDCVIITSGPFYTLPLCKICKTKYDTKCVVDFRDLFILDIRSIKKFLHPASLIRKLVFYPIERSAIKYADKVISVTDEWANILKKMYPSFKDKIEIIYNGFDDYYLNNNTDVETSGKSDALVDDIISEDDFNIISFGKLSYYSRDYAKMFIEALIKIQNRYPHVKLIQIGSEEEEIENIFEETGFVKASYTNTGFCDYKKGMNYLSFADLCIIIDIRNKAIGTKIYDYIYQNKPILYIGKKNTKLSNIVSSFEYGYTCQTEKQIINAILDVIEKNRQFLTSNNAYKKYSREYQNERFHQLIINDTETITGYHRN